MEVRLKILDQGVLLKRREALCLGKRVRRNVKRLPSTPDPGKPNKITSLLGLLTFLIEPDSNFGTCRNLLAGSVNVLIPGNLFTRNDQLPCARPEQVIPFANCPLHQLRTAVDEISGLIV